MAFKLLTVIVILFSIIKSEPNLEQRRLQQDSSCTASSATCNPNKATTTAYASGDPHWTTFGGWRHHFQGDVPLFYYLMTPCKSKGYGHDKSTGLPWNLVAKMIGGTGNSVKRIHEVILESVDEDGGKIYYLYVRNWNSDRIVGSYTRDISDQDMITIEQAMQQPTWNRVYPSSTALTVNLGVGRTASIYMNGNYVRVQVRIPSGCTNDNSIILDYKYHNTVVHVEAPPICYRCATCGLLGDFYESNGYLLNPFGKRCYVLNAYKYQDLGFMEATTTTPEPTSSPTAPPPGTTQSGSPIDCDSDTTTKGRVIDAVGVAYGQYIQNRGCCSGTEATDCNDEKDDSITDVCNYFKGKGHITDAELAAQAYKETAENLEAQCLQHKACAGHDSKKYVFIGDVKNWNDADLYCKNECGTELGIITSTADNQAALSACSVDYCWFGLHRELGDHTRWWWHRWKNNVLNKKQLHSIGYTFDNWIPGEPSNGTKELCGMLDKTKQNGRNWDDIVCGLGKLKAFICENPHYTGTTAANIINNDIDGDMNAGRPRRGTPKPKPKSKPQKPRLKPRPKPKFKPKPIKPRPKPRKRSNANDNMDVRDASLRANNVKTVKDNGNNNNGYYTGSLMMKWFIIGLLFGVLLTFCIGGPLNMLYKSMNNKKHQYKPVIEISSSDQSDDDTKNIL